MQPAALTNGIQCTGTVRLYICGDPNWGALIVDCGCMPSDSEILQDISYITQSAHLQLAGDAAELR